MSDMRLLYSRRVPALACAPTTSAIRGPEGAAAPLPPGPLIVVVTGSREWADYMLIEQNLNQFWIGTLHQGGARGADTLCRYWALRNSVEHQEHRANWTQEGRAAGPRRNIRMYAAAQPDLVVAFKDDFGVNPRGGTEHMVSLALKDEKPVWLVGDGQARWLQAA